MDSPREPRRLDTDGHLPRDWFSRRIWQPAVRAAGLQSPVRLHDLLDPFLLQHDHRDDLSGHR
jgi:hypothetical protein